jgi:hypothetical protein
MYSRLTDTGSATGRILLKVFGGVAVILTITAVVRGTGDSSIPAPHYYSPVQSMPASTPTPPIASVAANPARFASAPVSRAADGPPVRTKQPVVAAPVAVREPDYVYGRRYEPTPPPEQPYYPEIYSIHTRYSRTYERPTDSREPSPSRQTHPREKSAEMPRKHETTAPPKYKKEAPPRPKRDDLPPDHSHSSDRDPKHDSRR